MVAERKVKCARCGKWFKAADYRHTLCPSCTSAQRVGKQASPGTPANRLVTVVSLRSAGSPTRQAVTLEPEGTNQVSSPARTERAVLPGKPSSPAPGQPGSVAVTVRPSPGPEKQGERRPLELTPAQRQAVEARYLELATPHEFDGIRSQIAEELRLSKTLVKRAVKDLRQRLNKPSWWEERRSEPPREVIEAVMPRYIALLEGETLPPVGVHSQLAEELGLSGVLVYRAIRIIRTELGLPRFNERADIPPDLIEAEPAHAS